MLEVKKDTQKPRKEGKKQQESGYSPPTIIWQLWYRGSYLDSSVQIQNTVLQLLGFVALFFGIKFNFISMLENLFHSNGKEVISHLQQQKWQGFFYYLRKAAEAIFFYYPHDSPPSPTPCINTYFTGNPENYTEYGHPIKDNFSLFP